MKIALCISGQPRSVELTFPYINENIIQINKPDVFIHTWLSDDIKGLRPVAACGEVASNNIPHNIEEIIRDLYKPVMMVAEPQKEFDEKNYNDRKAMFIRPKNSISQRYSVLQSINLTGRFVFTYDAIIRMRFDWAIQTPIDISTLPLDKMTCPNDCPHPGGYNDQFAVSNAENMFKYAGLYYNLDYLYNDLKIPFVDEVLLGEHLKMHHIEMNPISIKYRLIRSDIRPEERFREDYVP